MAQLKENSFPIDINAKSLYEDIEIKDYIDLLEDDRIVSK
jgi:hypothetical protein